MVVRRCVVTDVSKLVFFFKQKTAYERRISDWSSDVCSFSYIAGYGLRLMPVIQGRSQLRALYGEDVARSIITNCGIEIAFTPKELDVATELSERLGFYGLKAKSKSQIGRAACRERGCKYV